MDCDEDDSYVGFASHLVLAFHHGITDGYSTHRIIRHLLVLLNNIMAGNAIDESKQISSIIDPRHAKILMDDVEGAYRADLKLLKERADIADRFLVATKIEKAFPVEAGLPQRTECLVHIVDKETTRRFIVKCREEGVTFHSGFCTVINASIMKVISDKCKLEEPITIPSLHMINRRRYYKDSCSAFGLGLNLFGMVAEISINILQNFWPAAGNFNDNLKHANQIKAGFENEVIARITGKTNRPELDEHGTGSPLPLLRYYVTSNMLDVTPLLGHVGDDVQLQFYDRLTSLQRFPVLWSSTFQTFRGQFVHSLQFNVHLLGYEAARKLSDTIFDIFSEVA